jgi:predicted nucleic acid-binding protein
VIIAAMLSRRGASFRILTLLGDPRFEYAISAALVLECEDVAFRPSLRIPLAPAAINSVLDRLCLFGFEPRVYFHTRPQLRDPGDEYLLELAVAGRCSYIVTHNVRDFAGAERFGIEVISPAEFLRLIGESHEHDQSESS